MRGLGVHLLGDIMKQMIEKLIATTIGQFFLNMANNWLIHYAPNPLNLFADGGRPAPGVPYIVGEKGPEIRIDDGPGSIIPNHMIGSSGSRGAGSSSMAKPGSNSTYGGDTHNHTWNIREAYDATETAQQVSTILKTQIPRSAKWAR
jgi:hypothetical protein